MKPIRIIQPVLWAVLTVSTYSKLALGEDQFTVIAVPNSSLTVPHGINLQGEIVGSYFDQNTNQHGFLLHKGTFTTIDVPGATSTIAFGINQRGDVIGAYDDVGFITHGFLLHKPCDEKRNRNAAQSRIFATIDAPGANLITIAYGISNRGNIVGFYIDASGQGRGFLLTRTECQEEGNKSLGTFNPIDVPGGFYTSPQGINAEGDIVGYYQKSDFSSHGFLLRHGTFSNIDARATFFTAASGINAEDKIVGFYINNNNQYQGFLLSDHIFTRLKEGTLPQGINDRGDIVGYYFDSRTVLHGFLLKEERDHDDAEERKDEGH